MEACSVWSEGLFINAPPDYVPPALAFYPRTCLDEYGLQPSDWRRIYISVVLEAMLRNQDGEIHHHHGVNVYASCEISEVSNHVLTFEYYSLRNGVLAELESIIWDAENSVSITFDSEPLP